MKHCSSLHRINRVKDLEFQMGLKLQHASTVCLRPCQRLRFDRLRREEVLNSGVPASLRVLHARALLRLPLPGSGGEAAQAGGHWKK